MKVKYLFLCISLVLGISATAQTKVPTKESDKVFSYVEVVPEAGYDIGQFFGENLKYPDTARKYNIEGRVILKFVVNEDGRVSDIEVTHGIGGGCDEEAMRVAKIMPAWKKPGSQNGKKVKVYFSMPIRFKLED
jgi:periplasmic protein TonB